MFIGENLCQLLEIKWKSQLKTRIGVRYKKGAQIGCDVVLYKLTAIFVTDHISEKYG